MSTIPFSARVIPLCDGFFMFRSPTEGQWLNLRKHISNRDTVAWIQRWVIPYRTDVKGNRYPECGVLGCGLIEPHWHGCMP